MGGVEVEARVSVSEAGAWGRKVGVHDAMIEGFLCYAVLFPSIQQRVSWQLLIRLT